MKIITVLISTDEQERVDQVGTNQDDDGVDNVVLNGVPPWAEGTLGLCQTKGGEQSRAKGGHLLPHQLPCHCRLTRMLFP